MSKDSSLVGLISDTHSYLGADVIKHLEDCDEIWHAGDIGDEQVIDQLEALGPMIRMVWGNIDHRDIRSRCPEVQLFDVRGLKVFMTHIGGYPGRYVKSAFATIEKEKPGLFICGHSHILKVIPDKERKLLHMNPGACGRHGLHQIRTLLKFEIRNARIEDLRVIELGEKRF